MTEQDKHWLAGIFDSRGSINMSKSNNVTGVITFNFGCALLCDLAITSLDNAGIWCNPVTQVGKTFKLNFSSSTGTQLLTLLMPYLRSIDHIRRAEVFMSVFPETRKGKHMKIDRLEGYNLWLKLLNAEEQDSTRASIIDRIKGKLP